MTDDLFPSSTSLPESEDSPSRSRASWPTPQAFAIDEKVEGWQARKKRKDAEGINLARQLSVEVQLSERSDSQRSTHTLPQSSHTAGLMSQTSDPFSQSPEIQSLSDAVFSRLLSLVDSLASRTASPESGEPQPTSGIYGTNAPECFGTYDPASRSSRMSGGFLALSQDFFSTEFCQTWPSFGSLANGKLYRQPMLERHTDESESGSSASMSWPTPTQQDGENTAGPSQMDRNSLPLNTAVVAWRGPQPTDSGLPDPESRSTNGSRQESWATPSAQTENGGPKGLGGGSGNTAKMRRLMGDEMGKAMCSGKLSPDWVECLMGYPIGHTQLPGKFVKPKTASTASNASEIQSVPESP